MEEEKRYQANWITRMRSTRGSNARKKNLGERLRQKGTKWARRKYEGIQKVATSNNPEVADQEEDPGTLDLQASVPDLVPLTLMVIIRMGRLVSKESEQSTTGTELRLRGLQHYGCCLSVQTLLLWLWCGWCCQVRHGHSVILLLPELFSLLSISGS